MIMRRAILSKQQRFPASCLPWKYNATFGNGLIRENKHLLSTLSSSSLLDCHSKKCLSTDSSSLSRRTTTTRKLQSSTTSNWNSSEQALIASSGPSTTTLVRNARFFSSEATKNNDKSDENKTTTTKVEKVEFQADTRKILDIMTHSIYTDKEVFLRELVSNASDALEKLRHAQAANTSAVIDPETPLEIRITLDEVESSITISDTGIGMTREEMIHNLGTIAKSGSSEFMQDLKRVEAGKEIDPASGIIGRFGVGFYSVFMISEKVVVTSRSAAVENANDKPQVWTSDGNGFALSEIDDEDIRVGRGTSIKLYVDSNFWAFVSEQKIEEILRKYSNFVAFPIYLMGRKLNTVSAIWTKDPKTIPNEEYVEFYRYIANAVDEPLDIIHFRADAPLDVKALFFIPSFHQEKNGAARIEPSVSLYCRKVLIEPKSKDILPDWLRFLKGAVDSEDLPLSISREKPQDSALIAKLRRALTRKILAHLQKMQKDDKETYVNEFYNEYNFFLKEGICQEYEFHPQLSKLIYFETSKNKQNDWITLDEYIARMKPEQKDIYYLCAPTREAAVNSPYMEMFDKAGVEVLFVFKTIDDFAMGNMTTYEDRKIVSIEKADIDLSDLMDKDKKDDDHDVSDLYKSDRKLSMQESVDFCNWYRDSLRERVASCTITNRLVTAPAIVTGHESGAIRRMLRSLDTSGGERDALALPKQHVEVNPKHPVIVGLFDMREKEPALARILAEQIFDNCLAAAGLLDDNRAMLPRLNDLLVCVVKAATGKPISAENHSKDESTTAADTATSTTIEAETVEKTETDMKTDESESNKTAEGKL